ncbi:MAG: hypothetical protein WDM80_06105 [Limisphaerales bacterium]
MKKASSTNIQAPEKFQIPNIKRRMAVVWELEAWCFSGAWRLEVGTFHPGTAENCI